MLEDIDASLSKEVQEIGKELKEVETLRKVSKFFFCIFIF